MFWQLETQRSQVQFTEPAVNLIDQAPSPCGSGQVATTDPPIYCVPSRAVDLPLSFLQSNIAPLGDAALALVVSNVYGYHIENLLGGLDPSAGLTGAQQQVIDSCFSGVFFVWLESQHALGPGDEASVNKLLAAAGGTSGSAGASGATADQLTTAFNQGLLSRGNTALCLPNHGGGGSPTTTT
jgi:predicted metalloprotease